MPDDGSAPPADLTVPESPESSETIEILGAAPAGAYAAIPKAQLERDEQDDLHKVLTSVAGVYVRDEDGFGLRPNIGMRGVAADRSAKITLLEDGVLSGPAPYTAPAAYYVPLVTRMSRIEVTKGPSAVLFGPATVGGAVDMISAPIPGERAAEIDVAGGTDRYGKLHLRAAERRRRWGVMVEHVSLRSAGFKQLDGGGDTGFAKDDVQLTAMASSDPSAARFHRLELRAGWAREDSNETYVGLSGADFARAPQRRYAATQLDRMQWQHLRLRASYRVELGPRASIDVAAYHHRFDREWGKVDAFVGQRDLYALLSRPESAANAVYYSVLAGAADSQSPEEQLIRGINDRAFVSQGVQARGQLDRDTGPLAHHAEAGLRLHYDSADRARHEDAYDMRAGQLVRAERMRVTALDSFASTVALAAFAHDRVRYGRFEVSAGVRVEHLRADARDRLDGTDAGGAYTVVIPGGGVQAQLTPELIALAGVHRGFVPVAPGAAGQSEPESSLNYEAGVRWRSPRGSADLVGFLSDYRNLKAACTLAAGCTEEMEGRELDGGSVLVWGVEASASAAPALPRAHLTAPLALAYTLTQSQFRSSFVSDFVGWGQVDAGDELPYLPAHQLTVSAGLSSRDLDDHGWDVTLTFKLRSSARDVAGAGEPTEAERLDALATWDLAAHWRLRSWAELYFTGTNLLDEQVIVSRRPYGARPNPPRMLTAGYKARF